MHGSLFLKDEHEISSNRTGPPTKSIESFKFPSNKSKGESSSAAKTLSYWKILNRIILTVTLITIGLVKTIGVTRIIKAVAISQVLIAYITPNLMIIKRSPNNSQKVKILEILPAPFNLIVSFDDFKNKTIYENIQITHLIHHNYSLSLFEGIVFSWCDSYLKNKRYPTNVTIVASSQVKSCVMGQYRWSLKLPKSLINFQSTSANSTRNTLTCPKKNKDAFDCGNKDRDHIRLKYSKLCPDMSPILLACTNRIALEKALSYKPPWSVAK